MHHQPQAALQQHVQRGATRHAWVLWRYWMLREFKTRYAGSVLGLAWAFVQPVATLAIFYVLFGGSGVFGAVKPS